MGHNGAVTSKCACGIWSQTARDLVPTASTDLFGILRTFSVLSASTTGAQGKVVVVFLLQGGLFRSVGEAWD